MAKKAQSKQMAWLRIKKKRIAANEMKNEFQVLIFTILFIYFRCSQFISIEY